ncbi:MAG: hypothetical protein HZB79_08760 [Deltaproteobacteria bacterium]|nr:hypothetical protein [Deltaproteobacteria bacterium]
MKKIICCAVMVIIISMPAIAVSVEVARHYGIHIVPNLKYEVPPKAEKPLGIRVATVTPAASISPWVYGGSDFKHEEGMGGTICFFTKVEIETGANKIDYEKENMGKVYVKSVVQDAGKIMLAKGFDIDGPYGTMDDIDIIKKEQIDFIFVSDISIATDKTEMRTKIDTSGCVLGAKTTRTYHGPFPIKMDVKLDFYAPVFGENKLLLSKKFSMETKREIRFVTDSKGNVEVDELSPAIVSAMEELYPKAMKKIWEYISIDEIKIIKKRAGELKKKT